MKQVFADSSYWIALANPRDQRHARAQAASRALGSVRIVTTDEVLVEFLNFFSKPPDRIVAVQMARSILQDANIEVVPQTRRSFLDGLEHYAQRQDKQYSLTDCVSFRTMEQRGLVDALTHDRHFVQAGYRALLRE